MNNKISETHIESILEKEFPELSEPISQLPAMHGPYKTAQCFANYTKQLIVDNNIELLKKCLSVADTLLINGNSTVKNIIENVYLYSIFVFTEMIGKTDVLAAVATAAIKKEWHFQHDTIGA